MKPSSRIQANIDILSAAHAARVPMDTQIGDYMRHRRYIGSKDRNEVVERAYNMMRAFARVSWWLTKLDTEDTPRNRVIVWLGIGEGCEAKRIKDLFDGSQYSPEPLNDEELALTAKLSGCTLDHDDMPDDIRAECPPEYLDHLQKYFGKGFQDEMAAMLHPATLDLRVNTFTAGMEKALKALEADSVEADKTPYSPWGLRCRSKAFLSRTKAFTKGWVEIQDEGSQMIAYLCGAKPGMQVIDYCAGAGGKTLALGAAMERKGRIVAMDNDARRLDKGRSRYKKASIADIVEVRPSEDENNRKWIKRQKEKFDIVLTDVPCTGTGTWRRNPDMRWRNYGPSLEELTVIQAEIMDKACGCVKPGGAFVYATCSLLPDENENQIAAFLERHPEFEIDAIDPELEIGTPFMRLTPLRHKTDGFFAARLVKKIEEKTEEQTEDQATE
jgi:16S rRNA (cytosine967-C5)-methyltransferase